MKHTKEEILEKAKKIMHGIDGEFYSESCIENTVFDKKEEISFGKQKGNIVPCWIVAINSMFDNKDLLYISDETREPIYYQNFNTFIFEVEKDKEGNYYLVKD